MPKVGSNYICLVVILIDFVLQNVNTLKKKNKVIKDITDDPEISSDDSNEEISDKE